MTDIHAKSGQVATMAWPNNIVMLRLLHWGAEFLVRLHTIMPGSDCLVYFIVTPPVGNFISGVFRKWGVLRSGLGVSRIQGSIYVKA